MGGQNAKWNELYIETEDQGISRNTDCPIFQFTKVDIYFSILQYNGQHKYIYPDWANPELLTNDKNIRMSIINVSARSGFREVG